MKEICVGGIVPVDEEEESSDEEDEIKSYREYGREYVRREYGPQRTGLAGANFGAAENVNARGAAT